MKPIEPMLATLTDAPFHLPGWVYEEKYDGIRGIATREGSQVKLWSRNLIERTKDFPDIIEALAALPDGNFVLDGEVVVFDRAGVSRFQLWQQGTAPVFVAFDCLKVGGRDLMQSPLSVRRAALESLVPSGDGAVRRSRRVGPDGLKAYQLAQQHGWEGIIAKDEAATYEPGRRTKSWLKVKVRKESELVIGGFTAPKGSRQDFGALLVGLFDGEALRYCGKVGTGFTEKTLAALGKKMKALETPHPPFAEVPRFRDATWVKPELVAQLAFHEWTGDGKLRHPVFLGLRDDKPARACTWAERER